MRIAKRIICTIFAGAFLTAAGGAQASDICDILDPGSALYKDFDKMMATFNKNARYCVDAGPKDESDMYSDISQCRTLWTEMSNTVIRGRSMEFVYAATAEKCAGKAPQELTTRVGAFMFKMNQVRDLIN